MAENNNGVGGVPPPPSGFVPDQQANSTPPQPPAGFVPDQQQSTPYKPTAMMSANPYPGDDRIQHDPNDGIIKTGLKDVGGLLEGFGQGAAGTLSGVAEIADKATGLVPNGLKAALRGAAGEGAAHGTAQQVGYGGETLME